MRQLSFGFEKSETPPQASEKRPPAHDAEKIESLLPEKEDGECSACGNAYASYGNCYVCRNSKIKTAFLKSEGEKK